MSSSAYDPTILRPPTDSEAHRPTFSGGEPFDSSLLEPISLPRNESERSAEPPAQAGRYRLKARHAQGGLGDVFRAEDEELHREVALKRLRGLTAGGPTSRARFLQEAELTAQLEHPGVVPVHGLVEDASGHPCYAMRFVEGETLGQALQAFQSQLARAADPKALFRGVEFRQLLQRFIAVCNTIAYAHSRGILHRDLKPANVLVGPFGETLLVDWGLAKRMTPDFDLPSDVTGPEGTAVPPTLLTSAANSGEQLTQAGQVLGTPSYMSPEQVDGGRLTPATDVYGLGAILYELLTGQPPAPGANLREALLKARDGLVAPPRRVQPAAPRGLEAICLKALARDPHARYRSALDLARDVENWLADEPLAALPEPWTGRLRRWVRRHRSWTAAAAALVVAALVLVSVSAWLLGKKNDELMGANARERVAARAARAEADRAERNYRLADEAIDKLLNRLAASKALAQPNLEPMLKALAEESLALQQKLLPDEAATPQQRYARALCLFRIGHLEMFLGRHDAAEQRMTEAIAAYERVVQGAGADPAARLDLAKTHFARGRLRVKTLRPEAALPDFSRTLALLEELGDASAPGPDAVAVLLRAETLLIRAYALDQLGRRAEALAELDRSDQDFATAHEAASKGLLKTDMDLRRRRAENRSFAAHLCEANLENARAGALLREAVDTLRELARQDPRDQQLAAELAMSTLELGVFVHNHESSAEAVKLMDQAEGLVQGALAAHPFSLNFRHCLGMICMNRHNCRLQLGQTAEAAADLDRAAELLRECVELAPQVGPYRIDYLKANGAQASLAAKLNQVDKAEALFEENWRRGERELKAHPEIKELRISVGGDCCNRGRFEIDRQDFEAAEVWFGRGIGLIESAQTPGHAWREAKLFLRNCFLGRAEARQRLNRPADAAEDWKRAYELDDGYYRALCVSNRVRCLMKADRAAEALAEMDAFEVPLLNDGGSYVEFAQNYAEAARRSQGAAREQARQRAVKLLAAAEKAGAFRHEKWRAYLRHPFFLILKDDPAFQKLFAEAQEAKKEK